MCMKRLRSRPLTISLLSSRIQCAAQRTTHTHMAFRPVGTGYVPPNKFQHCMGQSHKPVYEDKNSLRRTPLRCSCHPCEKGLLMFARPNELNLVFASYTVGSRCKALYIDKTPRIHPSLSACMHLGTLDHKTQ